MARRLLALILVSLLIPSVAIPGSVSTSEPVLFEGFEAGLDDWTLVEGDGFATDCVASAGEGACSLRVDPLEQRNALRRPMVQDVAAFDLLSFQYRPASLGGSTDAFVLVRFDSGDILGVSLNVGVGGSNNGVQLFTSSSTGPEFYSWPAADVWYTVTVSRIEGTDTVEAAIVEGGVVYRSQPVDLPPDATKLTAVEVFAYNWGNAGTHWFDAIAIDTDTRLSPWTAGFEGDLAAWTISGDGQAEIDCTDASEGNCSLQLQTAGAANLTLTTDLLDGDRPTGRLLFTFTRPVGTDADQARVALLFDDGTTVWFGWDGANGTRFGVNGTSASFGGAASPDGWQEGELVWDTGTGRAVASTRPSLLDPDRVVTPVLNLPEMAAQPVAIQVQAQGDLLVRIDDLAVMHGLSIRSRMDIEAPEGFYIGVPIFFTDRSDPTPTVSVTHHWDFGDGQTSTLRDPVVTYSVKGSHEVCMTVETLVGLVETTCRQIMIENAAPVAQFDVPARVWMTEAVVFNASSAYDPDGEIRQYRWIFGDGTPVRSGEVVSHTYREMGSYIPCLRVVDNNGAEDRFCQRIEVVAPLKRGKGVGLSLQSIRSVASAIQWYYEEPLDAHVAVPRQEVGTLPGPYLGEGYVDGLYATLGGDYHNATAAAGAEHFFFDPIDGIEVVAHGIRSEAWMTCSGGAQMNTEGRVTVLGVTYRLEEVPPNTEIPFPDGKVVLNWQATGELAVHVRAVYIQMATLHFGVAESFAGMVPYSCDL